MRTPNPARQPLGSARCLPLFHHPGLYLPRKATDSHLYRIVQDNLEDLLVRGPDDPARPAPFAEESLRRFLECGVPRFGMVRFRCPSCGESRFVPFSCRKRSCPSCDWKRAVFTSARAVEGLLPHVPWRQWVLVIPKRLRPFLNSDPALAGELCRILARVLTRFYRDSALPEQSGAERGGPSAAPALIEVVQRFGARVNAHTHVHAVVADGVFTLRDGKRLAFRPAPELTKDDLGSLEETLRRKVLRRFVRLGALPQEAAANMLRWEHSGFSLDGSVRLGPEDRSGLERLLRYCLRPAISLKRLEYRPELDLVRYRPAQGKGGTAPLLECIPIDFLRRFSRLIPPPRANLVRYAGALGPRSRLRRLVAEAARRQLPYEDLLAGKTGGLWGVIRQGRDLAREARTAAQRAWAACIRRVFEVDLILCPRCAVEMVPVAGIVDDQELERLLAHLGLSVEFPKTKPARAPPLPFGEDSQVDPAAERRHGIDPEPPGEWAAA